MGIPRLQGREHKREDAIDGYPTRNKESNLDSSGHSGDELLPRRRCPKCSPIRTTVRSPKIRVFFVFFIIIVDLTE